MLEPFRGKVPDEVFGEPYVPPVSDGSGQDRGMLRQAQQLLQQAGVKRGDDGVLRLPDGTRLTIEFLEFDSGLTKHVEAFGKNLRLLGIGFTIRQVDPSQYQRRVQDYDYDCVSARFVMSLTPGETLNTLFGSQRAHALLAQPRRGCRSIGRCDDRQGDRGQVEGRDHPCRPGALTGCCARGATGCRPGMLPSINSPIGTCIPPGSDPASGRWRLDHRARDMVV